MSIIYYDIECDFTQIPNHIILNHKISGTAKAIYFYIIMRLRQNAKWEFYDFDIMEHLKEGRDSFRNAKKELLEYGYLVKVRQNVGSDGKYKGCDYAIKKEPITEKPTSAKPKTDEPTSENPSTNNKKQNNNINKKQSNKDKDTASGFSQNDFLENFIKERLSKMSESAKAGYYAFTVTQLESFAEKLGRPLTQIECQERCKMILDGMYPQSENSVINDSFTTQNPTVKESLTVQKPKKEIQITKKEDIESFVRNFKANEFEVDGVIQFQSIFSENEIELITGYLLKRKEKHKSRAKSSQQAIKAILNKILEIKGVHALEVVFDQHDGCYVNCGTAGDPTTPWIRLELEYFTKLIKKSTFINQYVKPKPDYLEVQKRYATTGELQLSTTYRKRRD